VSAQGLAAAVNALFVTGGFPSVVGASSPTPPADGTVRVFDGQVPGTAPVAFVVVNHRIPNVVSRSEGRSRLAHRCYALVTVTAATAEGARVIAQRVIDALEGGRPVADGWSTTPLALLNAREPVEDRDVQAANGRFPMFAKIEFDYTATLV
jgi:hypothetical protein